MTRARQLANKVYQMVIAIPARDDDRPSRAPVHNFVSSTMERARSECQTERVASQLSPGD